MAFPYSDFDIPTDGAGSEVATDVTDSVGAEPTATVAGEVPESDPTTSAQTDDFNIDQYGDRVVKVTVDGEELEVPLKEALAGYSRTADYTRKTQALAAERQQAEAFQALQKSLQERPQETLQALQARFLAEQAAERQLDPQYDEPADPRYAALEAQLAQLQAAEADRQLTAELTRLQSTYTDFDPQKVITAAQAQGVQDIRQLEAVYKQLSYDSVYAKLAVREAQEAEEAARRAAGLDAAGVTSSGSGSAQNGSTPKTYNTIEEAFEAAEAATGFAWN